MVPLAVPLGRSERRVAAASYVSGLLMPGQRKSIEPMAERLRVDSQKLQQFISDSPWPDRPVWKAIRREVIPAVEPLQAWVLDETGWLKQGRDSVGVSHQYCGAVGKQARCQIAVELVVSDGEVAAPVGGRLYLPEVWVKDPKRRDKAGIPSTVTFQTKPEIAGDLIEQALADGLTSAPILGDSVYGRACSVGQGFLEHERPDGGHRVETACHIQQPGAAIVNGHEDDVRRQGEGRLVRCWLGRDGLDGGDHVQRS